MTPRHIALALLVVLIWGLNFVVIHEGLAGMPPLLFVAIRFACILPIMAFVPRPQVAWRDLALVGLLMSAGQFGFLYSAMAAGLASLILQAQALFTVVIAAVLMTVFVLLHKGKGGGLSSLFGGGVHGQMGDGEKPADRKLCAEHPFTLSAPCDRVRIRTSGRFPPCSDLHAHLPLPGTAPSSGARRCPGCTTAPTPPSGRTPVQACL